MLYPNLLEQKLYFWSMWGITLTGSQLLNCPVYLTHVEQYKSWTFSKLSPPPMWGNSCSSVEQLFFCRLYYSLHLWLSSWRWRWESRPVAACWGSWPAGPPCSREGELLIDPITFCCIESPVLWIWIRNRKDPELFPGSGIIVTDPYPARMKEQIN